MPFQHHEYELLTVLEAEAIGEPGQRRFRLIAGTAGDIVMLWMEKFQLRDLGLAIEQLLEQLGDAGLVSRRITPTLAPAPQPLVEHAPEYLIGKMAIGYDSDRRLIAIFAHELDDEADEPVFSARVTLANSKALAQQIAEVVAAGRPTCPRCGAVIGPEGHVCPHDNGHLPWEPDE